VLIPSFLSSQVAKGKSMFAGKVGGKVASGRSRSKTIRWIRRFRRRAVRCGGDADAAAGADRGGGTARFPRGRVLGRKIGTGSTGSCRRPGPKALPRSGSPTFASPPAGIRCPRCLRPLGTAFSSRSFSGSTRRTRFPAISRWGIGDPHRRRGPGRAAPRVRRLGQHPGSAGEGRSGGFRFPLVRQRRGPSLMVSAISVGGD